MKHKLFLTVLPCAVCCLILGAYLVLAKYAFTPFYLTHERSCDSDAGGVSKAAEMLLPVTEYVLTRSGEHVSSTELERAAISYAV